MNDLLLKMPKGSILSYADDTVIITDDNTWYHAQDRMNDLLKKVAKCLAFNKLIITKTRYMKFGCYCESVPREIFFFFFFLTSLFLTICL